MNTETPSDLDAEFAEILRTGSREDLALLAELMAVEAARIGLEVAS